ncbi:MAG: class D sortase [Oscillibacter sp.]|nr:class D sortase [Oscillibacter sp.]
MKWNRWLSGLALSAALLALPAQAMDYNFSTAAPQDFYKSGSYEDVYGSQYNYGGRNVVDYQIPELEYGLFSTTQTGVMERTTLPGLQAAVATSDGTGGGGFGVSGGGPITALTEAGSSAGGTEVFLPPTSVSQPGASQEASKKPVYTSIEGMKRKDGSIGTVKIPSLDINMKVWEGETNASMKKGLGHYSSTSAWDGNVGVCGHNRGAKYTIGSIKDLEYGDTITYTTVHGTRTYSVVSVKTISNSDWSDLQAASDNRITLTTCLANQPEKRICVQAVEKTA